jgi:hypothetical protein
MDMDLDVDHYTIAELTDLLDLKVLTHEAIMAAVDEEMARTINNHLTLLHLKTCHREMGKGQRGRGQSADLRGECTDFHIHTF